MEELSFVSKEEAKAMLSGLKKEGYPERPVIVLVFDFSAGSAPDAINTTCNKAQLLVDDAESVVVYDDAYYKHVQLHTQKQHDVKNILMAGRVFDLIFLPYSG